MWSLGCLYLEFITWLVKGSDRITFFSDFRAQTAASTGISEDNFYTIVHDSDGMHAVVREQVCEWVEELHADEKCSQLIHELLDLTMKDLLVIDSHSRVESRWLHQQLRACWNRAKTDTEYMLKPVPRPSKQTRSNSTSALISSRPKPNAKNRSVAFVPTVTNGGPKDLVLRNGNTPGYSAPKKFSKSQQSKTWPRPD